VRLIAGRLADDAGCIDPSLCVLADSAVHDLRRAGLTVVTAESCTGGVDRRPPLARGAGE
jgi:hypothetical protein